MTLWEDLSPCRWPFTTNHAQIWEIWIQKLFVGLVAELLAGWIQTETQKTTMYLMYVNVVPGNLMTSHKLCQLHGGFYMIWWCHHLAVDIAISCSWRTSDTWGSAVTLGWHEMCPKDSCSRRVHHIAHMYTINILIFRCIHIYVYKYIYVYIYI